MTEITQADRDAADKHGFWLLDDEREALTKAFARHREAAAAEERAKIVAWLRSASNGSETVKYGNLFADEIEAGEHLK